MKGTGASRGDARNLAERFWFASFYDLIIGMLKRLWPPHKSKTPGSDDSGGSQHSGCQPDGGSDLSIPRDRWLTLRLPTGAAQRFEPSGHIASIRDGPRPAVAMGGFVAFDCLGGPVVRLDDIVGGKDN